MEPWIREKIKQIKELYPDERLEKSKARWRAIWAGETPPGRYPYLFLPVSMNYYNDVFAKETGLTAYLDEFIYRGIIDDDFIPAFFPGCKQGTIPSMFGAKEIVVGRDYTNERILFSAKDIDNLPEPFIHPGTSAFEWLEMQKYYLEECEGEIPVHVCDMQGPMDVSGQLWGYENLFLCAYDDEERFHRLLETASDAFCMLWDAQQKLLGKHFIGTHLYGWDWVPENNGATLSADSMAMLSGDFFEEYYSGHLEKLAKRFGGITVHSCGDFNAVVRRLCAIPGVKAVNASQMTVEQLLDAGWSSEKPIILQEDIERAPTVFALAKEKRLWLNTAFSGLWPLDENDVAIHPSHWTNEHKNQIKNKAARVNEAALI
ncbi:MAG: hypothetical protein FWG94_07325 [Oscillospiraceae bacterium]|nr:hypothetical protein [Oscillospiraceae bacterium]